ncbi:hypothetical protein HPG69_008678 [Diceros bicornis minor]|uniref:Uncharacterized protein n=1 Tax=Diceros bicornis minor TaxID=77932 RepID=A0A7J7FA96_DICBM|nr:hypothetical protein HPG69_008678 [Diceros bicornis minor]
MLKRLHGSINLDVDNFKKNKLFNVFPKSLKTKGGCAKCSSSIGLIDFKLEELFIGKVFHSDGEILHTTKLKTTAMINNASDICFWLKVCNILIHMNHLDGYLAAGSPFPNNLGSTCYGSQMDTRDLHPGLYQGYRDTLPLAQPEISEHKRPNWRQNTHSPTFLARPGLLVPVNASHYCMHTYKRAQLKAILSQMNSSLSLRLCKANRQERKVLEGPAEASHQQSENDRQEELGQPDALGQEDAGSPREGKSKQPQGDAADVP